MDRPQPARAAQLGDLRGAERRAADDQPQRLALPAATRRARRQAHRARAPGGGPSPAAPCASPRARRRPAPPAPADVPAHRHHQPRVRGECPIVRAHDDPSGTLRRAGSHARSGSACVSLIRLPFHANASQPGRRSRSCADDFPASRASARTLSLGLCVGRALGVRGKTLGARPMRKRAARPCARENAVTGMHERLTMRRASPDDDLGLRRLLVVASGAPAPTTHGQSTSARDAYSLSGSPGRSRTRPAQLGLGRQS